MRVRPGEAAVVAPRVGVRVIRADSDSHRCGERRGAGCGLSGCRWLSARSESTTVISRISRKASSTAAGGAAACQTGSGTRRPAEGAYRRRAHRQLDTVTAGTMLDLISALVHSYQVAACIYSRPLLIQRADRVLELRDGRGRWRRWVLSKRASKPEANSARSRNGDSPGRNQRDFAPRRRRRSRARRYGGSL